jgi:multimeric flavodoxin WrbA
MRLEGTGKTMEVIAFNGSPRKVWNTATLLKKALEGAASQGASTKLIHLYDLDFKGCKSCFGCKMKGGPSYGKCAVKDDLTPILEEIKKTDAIIMGSPVYFWGISGEMKSFLERLMFPFYHYTEDKAPDCTLFPKIIHTGFIYTMGAREEWMKGVGFERSASLTEMFLKRIFGTAESLFCCDTYQFDDYSKIDQRRFDPEQKAARRREQFPLDCQRAFTLGVGFATPAK